MAVSSGPSGALATMRAVCKSCDALVSHSRVSWARASSIEFAPVPQNLVLEGRAQMAISVEFGASLGKYVLAHVQIAETVVRPLHPLDGRFRAFRNDDHNVNVAVLMRRTPGVRTEKINLHRLKFLFEPFNGFVQKAGRNSFHGV